jgi:hypothetical protein
MVRPLRRRALDNAEFSRWSGAGPGLAECTIRCRLPRPGIGTCMCFPGICLSNLRVSALRIMSDKSQVTSRGTKRHNAAAPPTVSKRPRTPTASLEAASSVKFEEEGVAEYPTTPTFGSSSTHRSIAISYALLKLSSAFLIKHNLVLYALI